MVVEIDPRGATPHARLRDPDDFGSFKVTMVDESAPTSEALAAIGVAKLEEHAWIGIEALRSLAGSHATQEWEASFQSMLDFARSRGWVDEELAAVRGHVERRRSESG